ncbi:MAG: hypothetical protein ACOCW6_03310 [Spirochaetota bacterium]
MGDTSCIGPIPRWLLGLQMPPSEHRRSNLPDLNTKNSGVFPEVSTSLLIDPTQ